MKKLKGALVGCGFFAQNHLHAWNMLADVEMVALCDRDQQRAAQYAKQFKVPHIYSTMTELLQAESLDFVDIATQADTHRQLVEQAAARGVHVICQKPLAPTLDDARAMQTACDKAGVQFMVHENFRWQAPLRKVKDLLPGLGKLFFGRIHFRSGFDVYAGQPYLAKDKRFIIYDLGVHLLDLARFYFGEVSELYCNMLKVNPKINGEDAAVIMLKFTSGATGVVDLSYASHPADELFPQTLVELEGDKGSIRLDGHYHITRVLDGHIEKIHAPPLRHSWCSEPGLPVQSSVFEIQKHWVDCLQNRQIPETSARDNIHTLELVFGAYASAESASLYKFHTT